MAKPDNRGIFYAFLALLGIVFARKAVGKLMYNKTGCS